ncbi:hypothetical protein FRC03_010510 [Tulasnella sp. 419]|nr:hypothetical protein FRC03_010510 [Tulasnella sp. 419]
MLPTEILAIIVAFSERNTLAKLALSNCRFKELAQPNLYQSIKFKYDEKIIDRIKQLFQTLASNASLASLVIRLSVTGNNRWNGGFMSTQESRQFIQLLAEGFAKMHNLSTIRFDGMAPFDGVFFQVINNATIKTFRTSLAMCPENFRWLSEQEHLEKLEVPCWFIRISKVATILDQERGCNVFKHLTSVRAPVVTVATIVAYGQPSLEAIYFTFDEPIENGPPDLNLNEIQAMFKHGVGPLKKLVFEFLVGERSVKTILEILGQYHGSTLETLSILMPSMVLEKKDLRDRAHLMKSEKGSITQ